MAAHVERPEGFRLRFGAPSADPLPEQRARLARMRPAGRRAAYERGELSYRQCYLWAAGWPNEVPIVNGEFEFIALTMADLDDD
jgi:hypothetical protein